MTDFGEIKMVEVPGPMRIQLVNYTNASDDSFVMCKAGAPGNAEDHVAYVNNAGETKHLCADKAKALIEPIAEWPLPKDWEQIVEAFKIENVRRKISYLEDPTVSTLYKMEEIKDIKKFWESFPEEDKERVIALLPQYLESKNMDIALEATFLAYDKIPDHPRMDNLLVDLFVRQKRMYGGGKLEEIIKALSTRPGKLSVENMRKIASVRLARATSGAHSLDILKVRFGSLDEYIKYLKISMRDGWHLDGWGYSDVAVVAIDDLLEHDKSLAIDEMIKIYGEPITECILKAECRPEDIKQTQKVKDAYIIEKLTKIYEEYGDKLDQDRLKISSFLLNALKSDHFLELKVLYTIQIVADHPHHEMKMDDINELLQIYSKKLVRATRQGQKSEAHGAKYILNALKKLKTNLALLLAEKTLNWWENWNE